MSSQVNLRGYHHATLTVTDINRSREFYTSILDLNVIAELSPTRLVLGNDHMIMAISEAPDPAQAIADDSFNENRVGLDHVSFAVESRQELERAQQLCDAAGVGHGTINDLAPFGFSVMTVRDPDNIQLELSAPIE